MSQQEKGELWRKLKAAGVEPSKHYREYTTEDLQKALDEVERQTPPAPPPPPIEDELSPEEAAAYFSGQPLPQAPPGAARMPERPVDPVPVAEADPAEMPGQRLNDAAELQPIRQDEQGRVWYQEEVRKPATAQPRGRRVLNYVDTGTREERVIGSDGTVETFEVAGQSQRRSAQVKITLPSYQVGMYRDPRFPFMVHTYNGNQGFDLFEVQNYYGGAELVPTEVKRIYVENVLCYDIRTVVRAIQQEYTQLRLAGRVQ